MAEHLIVISVDALVYEDLDYMGKLENTRALLRRGSLVKRVNTVYPSLTHMVHTALMTGCTPGKNGVISNDHFEPGNLRPLWYNNLSEVRRDTLFHAAKRKGLTSCACRWPVTAGGFDVIDYLVPEIMDSDRECEPDLKKLHREMSSPALGDIIDKNIHLIDWSESKHPTDEEFQIQCACDIIRRYKPNLLMTHPAYVDSIRHQYGLFSDKLNEALEATDRWIGMIMRAVRDAGIEDSTSIAVISDHGHLQQVRTAALNVLFRQKGYIEADASGALTSWKVYAKDCGLSSEIYVADTALEGQVYRELVAMAEAGLYGFSEVLTREEARQRYGLYGPFAFIVETDGFTGFCDDWTGKVMRIDEPYGVRYSHSSHGHMPHKGPQPPMIVCGPDFRQGVVLERAQIIDEAPTFARVLGLELPEAEGRPIEALLK